MARLYADENFPQPAVERLRELRHDVLTVQDAGKAQQKLPDEACWLMPVLMAGLL